MLNTNTVKIDPDGPPWVLKLIGAALFLAFGIAMYGILLSVEYRWAKVLDVNVMAGKSAHDRMVLIETPERMRVLRTSDPFVATPKGGQVCVAKRRMIARRWLTYRVVLPGYCRSQPRNLPAQSTFVID